MGDVDVEKAVKRKKKAAPTAGDEATTTVKKVAKKKTTTTAAAAEGEAMAVVVKKKKRKAASFAAAAGEEDGPSAEKKKKKKKDAAEAEKETETETKKPRTRSASNLDEMDEALKAAPAGSRALSDFAITEATRLALFKRNVRVLFPIQARTFEAIFDRGEDVLARARTGTGKTLAFALPIIERLVKAEVGRGHGRAPSCVVLAPTRELALQVFTEFESCAAGRLACVCVYGGAPYGPQCDPLRRGVDVVVGTPGRTNDLIEKGVLNFNSLRFAVLDEADQMLDMGFKDELDRIFNAMLGDQDRQLLLFSATLPNWVQATAERYAKKVTRIDLVGSADGLEAIVQASTDVRHVCVPCGHWSEAHSAIQDLIGCYGGGEKRTIVFCETKNECNELCDSDKLKADRRALHGDIPQNLREKTMAAFRKGGFKVLVATDVAARGLDMVVDLVINNKPPASRSGRADAETYVHRSGRTGRAGRKGGVCVTLYTPRHKVTLQEIERSTKNAFEWIGAPQLADVLETAADQAIDAIRAVDAEVLPLFAPAALRLAALYNDDDDDHHLPEDDEEVPGATQALRAALARISGYETKPAPRSRLTNSENFVTCRFDAARPMTSLGYVWTALRRAISDGAAVESVKGMQLAADSSCAIFDVPAHHAQAFDDAVEELTVDVRDALPTLKQQAPVPNRGKGKGFFFSKGKGGSASKGKGGRGRSSGKGRGRGF